MTHTPGPYWICETQNGSFDVGAGDYVIALVETIETKNNGLGYFPGGTAKDNARLFMAAPKLLERLDGLLEQAEAMYKQLAEDEVNAALLGDALDEIDNSHATIREAAGE